VQEQWAAIQTFFESTHFASVQHACGPDLEELLQCRLQVRQGQDECVCFEPQPLDARDDPAKRVDPIDLMYRWTRNSDDTTIPKDALVVLLASARELLERDAGPLLDLRLPEGSADSRLVIVGDTHGQLLDVLHIFHTQGPPSESCTYLFNGDVADRGSQAVEILILLLAFKLRYPRNVHVIRGNHENREINERPKDLGGGFLQECLEKYGDRVYEMFEGIFSLLPLFAVVQDEVFVVHGGLFRSPNVTLDTLRSLSNWQQHYPMFKGRHDMPASTWSKEQAILFDAQWGDPHPMEGFRPSRRGPGVLDFGRDVTADFLERNGLKLCVRSHEVPRSGRGFAYTHGQRLLTVFSASNYCGVMGNRGAVAVLQPRASAPPDSGDASDRRLFGDVMLRVVEHDISAERPESNSHIFRQASLAQKLASDCYLQQPALAILLFNREALRAKCSAADVLSTGTVSKDFLLNELTAISCDIHWEPVMCGCLKLGAEVAYNSFLDSIRVRWLYSVAEQTANLAALLLNGELPFGDLASLLTIRKVCTDGEEHAYVNGWRTAAKLLAPEMMQWQHDDIVSMLGGADDEPAEDFLGRLMLFAPATPPPQEAWMREAPAALYRLLRTWAGTQNGILVACRFFRAHPGDDPGVLSAKAMAGAIEGLLLAAEPADLAGLAALFSGGEGAERCVDHSRVRTLVDALSSSGSGTISFLELACALVSCDRERHCSPVLLETMASQVERNTGVEEFLFSYRGALLRGCRFVDTDGSGLLEPKAFVEVAVALAEIVGQPLTQRQARRLEVVLGSRLVPYAWALSRFEKVLDKDVAAGVI